MGNNTQTGVVWQMPAAPQEVTFWVVESGGQNENTSEMARVETTPVGQFLAEQVNAPGGEKIPAGGWRGGQRPQPGGEKIPPGGWRGGQRPQPGGEKIPPGGWRSASTDEYRTRDAQAWFTFRFVPVGGHYEIDIVDMPSYKGVSVMRSSNLHPTHRLPSGRGGHRICFGVPSAVSSISDCYEYSASWAENTWEYIQTGRRF